MKCLAASFNTKCQWAVAGRTSAPVVTGFEKTAANLTLAFERVRRDAKSIRCCLSGQPEISFHAPTSVSGDPLDAVQLCVAVCRLSSLKAGNVVIALGQDLSLGHADVVAILESLPNVSAFVPLKGGFALLGC